MPLITLLTDFGTADYFVAAVKGVILSANSDARIVDITHDIPPHDIEDAAFNALPDEVEIRYSTVPIALEQYLDGVDVEIRDLTTETTIVERFDLVVGADGLRSTVRRLAFEPEQSPIRPMNYMIAAYSLPGAVPGYRPQDGLILAEEGRSAWVFPQSRSTPGEAVAEPMRWTSG